MKKKDIALIIAIAGVAGIISLVCSRLLFVTPANRQQQVEVASPISTEFTPPSNKYFNSSSIDPTMTIQIGNNQNLDPFKGSE